MDTEMQHALREFQKANKLPVTGRLDEGTAEKLGVLTGKQPRSGVDRDAAADPSANGKSSSEVR